MNIIVSPFRRNGCSYYRVTEPYKALKRRGHNVFFLDSQKNEKDIAKAFEAVDTLLLRPGAEPLFKKFRTDLPHVKIVYDLDDDLWDINPFSQAYQDGGTEEVEWNGQMLWESGKGEFNPERNQKRLDSHIEVLKEVDLITVTTNRLRQTMQERTGNENIAVVPNAINFDVWQPLPLKKGDIIRLGWSGGASHYVDWYSIKDALPEVMEGAKLVLAGEKWNGTIKGLEHEYHDWVDEEAHPYRMAGLNIDIGLIPLKDMSFNHHKSCLKWYEFSALKIPCVLANVQPYSDEVEHGVNGFLYDTPEEFVEYMNRLKADPELRDKIANAAYEWVKTHRSSQVVAEIHEEILQTIHE